MGNGKIFATGNNVDVYTHMNRPAQEVNSQIGEVNRQTYTNEPAKKTNLQIGEVSRQTYTNGPAQEVNSQTGEVNRQKQAKLFNKIRNNNQLRTKWTPEIAHNILEKILREHFSKNHYSDRLLLDKIRFIENLKREIGEKYLYHYVDWYNENPEGEEKIDNLKQATDTCKFIISEIEKLITTSKDNKEYKEFLLGKIKDIFYQRKCIYDKYSEKIYFDSYDGCTVVENQETLNSFMKEIENNTSKVYSFLKILLTENENLELAYWFYYLMNFCDIHRGEFRYDERPNLTLFENESYEDLKFDNSLKTKLSAKVLMPTNVVIKNLIKKLKIKTNIPFKKINEACKEKIADLKDGTTEKINGIYHFIMCKVYLDENINNKDGILNNIFKTFNERAEILKQIYSGDEGLNSTSLEDIMEELGKNDNEIYDVLEELIGKKNIESAIYYINLLNQIFYYYDNQFQNQNPYNMQ